MARKVFFSFHYENDISGVMVARNSGAFKSVQEAGFIDAAAFEKVKLQGQTAIHKWIDEQLHGTTMTVVLIGKDTLDREYVKYEICQSINKGNAIIGVHICNIKDMRTQQGSHSGNIRTQIGTRGDSPKYFNEVACSIHDYINDSGYVNMGTWIEAAAINKGK